MKYISMKLKLQYFYLSLFLLSAFSSFGQSEKWVLISEKENNFSTKELKTRKNIFKKSKVYTLNYKAFVKNLQNTLSRGEKVIELPSANAIEKFSIKEAPSMANALSEKFPMIKSFIGKGIDDPTKTVRFSLGTDGLHIVVFVAGGNTFYIDPYTNDNNVYVSYSRGDLSKVESDFECLVENEIKSKKNNTNYSNRNANDGMLRTYRLALVCSGEYAQFHLNRQGVLSSATDSEKKAAVLSAMNTSMTRINGVFERDLGVKMEIVANNDKVVFLDAATDNISDGNAGTMINEVQIICDNEIGDGDYDIGHVFSIGGDGLAGLDVVCVSGQKAKGVTGIGSPINDPYDIDYVSHEMGHQFGATHTQNNSCNRTNYTAVEPGSASTIMGYAGICAPNVLSVGSSTGNSEDNFHAVSIDQMWSAISANNCAVKTETNNAAPTASAGVDINIPKSTPFKLTGVATDADGMGSLTYNWEQIDPEIGAIMPPATTNVQGPMFRSLPSNISPTRYFPDLATVIAGSTSNTWEVVPSVARDMNFSLLVRDNHVGGGSSARDDISVTVTDAAPFLVTGPSTNVSWNTGYTQTITWDKSTTDTAPINCTNVNIKLSTDGGITFPITLLANTPNDGTEDIVIPDYPTVTARIMIEAVDNVFYNVNSTNFTINSSEPTFIITNNSGDQNVCNSGNQTANYLLNFNFVNGFSEIATLTTLGEPLGSTVVFSPTTINANGDISLTISDLDGKAAEEYTITVTGTSNTVTQNIDVNLKLYSATFNSLTLTSPINGATDTLIADTLMWDEDINATSYDVEVATDAAFNSVVLSGNVTTSSYTTSGLSGVTEYFWRVKPKNTCGQGSFSSSFSFTTVMPEYCSSNFTAEADHILNVTFGGINNDSGNNRNDGYDDFTSIKTKVLRGQTKKISVTIDTDGFQDHIFVFIDWNQDYLFDIATERYDLGTITEDQGTGTFDITVPNDAVFGDTRMRVIEEYDDPTDSYGEGACDADHLTEFGETEDYTVTVVEPLLNPNNYIVASTNETVAGAEDGAINVTIAQEEFSYDITVTGSGINIAESISVNSFDLGSLAPGDYEICITAVEANDTQCFDLTIEAAKVIVAPDNYTIKFTSESCLDQNDGSIEVSIKQEEFSYQVKVTGPATNVTETLTGFSYSIFNLIPGDYEVCVILLQSNQTYCYEFTIEESQPISLKAEPNKVSGKYAFNIKTGSAPYTVYLDDKIVKVVYEKEFEVSLKGGGKVEVKSSKECEGAFRMSLDNVLLLQNPVSEKIDLLLPFDILETTIEVTVFSANGKLIYKSFIVRKDNSLTIPFKNYASGVYILKLSLENSKSLKIIKQ